MLKNFIFIIFIAVISYYAGSQGLSIDDFLNFFEDNKIGQKFSHTVDNTLELINEKK